MKKNSKMSENQQDYAGRIFLLMGKEYRISRSIRAQWFFQHINSPVNPKTNQELISSHEELEVLSVMPEASNIHNVHSFRLAPCTRITFIGRQYRFVFCLDVSPSEGAVNVETGKILLEEVFENFMNCIVGLVEPFSVPGSSLVLAPELVITVLAHTPLAQRTCQVLVQGLTVSQRNIYELLYEVRSKLQTLEDLLANKLSKKYEQELYSKGEAGETDENLNDTDSSLFNMVRDALLALQLLPDNASAGLVIVTDGVFNLSDASVVDAVLAQMRASTVVCSFLQIGGGARYGFGYIPHTSLMQFIATATSGAYICTCPKVSTADPKQQNGSSELQGAQPMNIYHEALLCWNFHTDTDRGKIAYDDIVDKKWLRKMPFFKEKIRSISQPMQKIKHSEIKLTTRISSVLSVRLREGYSIENVAISKDGTQLEVKLTLPWKEHVLLEYTAKAAWPLDQFNRSTHVDVFIKGSYDFLVDITSKQKFTSSYRKTVVYKFEQTMKSLQATDELLVRLQSFSVNPAYTTIPDSAKDGIPLFHLPQSSRTPVLSLQQGKSKKSTKSQEGLFAEYWKPILHLDFKTWQKWFHCHRVSILLENDRPISKSLFIPTSSERFHTVHCRTAMNALNRALRDWSSFVLLENHSYIRFLESKSQKTPYSFCLLRLVFKGLCVVIRLAFLGGTAGAERHRIVSELKESLDSIKAPLKKPLFSPEHTFSAESPPKSVVLTTKEKKCVIFLDKPLERILLKYDSIPDDLKCVEYKALEDVGLLDATQSSSRLTPVSALSGPSPERSNAILGALSRYMYSQRWLWKMSCQTKALPNGAVAAILYALTKRRLLEGFHFCSSNQNGIITMVKELPMQLPTCSSSSPGNVCVLQFVLFPPHRCVQLKEGFQDESVESDAIRDGKGDLQIATEIWVEPQSGIVVNTDSGFKYVEGLKYNEIPERIFSKDLETVKEMVTYSHLESMCIDSLLTTVPQSPCTDIKSPSDWCENSSVVDVPFLFDIIPLLAKSTQICLLLPLLKDVKNEILCSEQRPNDILLSLFFNSLMEVVDCEVPLTNANCAAFSSFVQKRCDESESSGKPAKFQVHCDGEPLWRCFAGASRRSVMILIVPATLSDVEKINLDDISTISTEQAKAEKNENGSKFDDEVARSSEEDRKLSEDIDEKTEEEDSTLELRESVDESKQEDSSLTEEKRPYLPVFIYECRFSVISDIRPSNKKEENKFADLRSKLSDNSTAEDRSARYRPDDIDILGKSTEFSAFCKSLADRYFQTFVNGVFKNLQLGFALDSKDVESSVELICEESCIEVDITSFIRIICMHFRNQRIDEEVFDYISEGNMIIRRANKLSSGSTTKSTPRTPVTATPKCGSEAVHKFVQSSFLEILKTKFSNVPENNELFYYNAKDEQVYRDIDSISDAMSDVQESDLQHAATDFYGSTENLPSPHKEDETKKIAEGDDDVLSELSRVSLKGSTNSLSGIDTVDAFSEPESEETDDESEEASGQHPLFLHLMCSLRDRNLAGSEMGLLPVNTLPTCLAEIIRMLEGGNQIDPFSLTLKVTLDLICLTLPPEIESGKSWKVVDEATSTRATSDSEDDFLVDEHGSIAEDQMKQGVFELNDEKEIASLAPREKASTLIDNTLTDPLKTLPNAQLNAFKVIVKKIEWLLKDEIASALINSSPVTEATLDNVADHVRNSSSENCQYRRISLRFVCGLDKSLLLFMNELSEATINDFRLLNKGKYFYLAADESSDPNVTSDTELKVETSKSAGSISNDSQIFTFPSKDDNVNVDTHRIILSNGNVKAAKATFAKSRSFDEDKEETPAIEGHNATPKSTENVLITSNKATLGGQDDSPQSEPNFLERNEKYAFCQNIILEAIDQVACGGGHEGEPLDDGPRLRSGSLPVFERENEKIVRRRFSDTGISYDSKRELYLDLEDTSAEMKCFAQPEAHRKPGPDFWLFASVQGSEVMVFHHKRREAFDSGDVQSEKCYIDLLGMIDKIGRLVNQKMLLDDLHETFTCHNLLVAEEDEQIWSRRETSPAKQLVVSGISEMGMSFEFSKVVHGEFEFHPGFFECDKVWETFLSVHYRLKSSPGQSKGTSKASQAVRAVLERFAVHNRSNLFVYRESSGNVFYFRIHETQESEQPQLTSATRNPEIEDQLKEDNLSYNSAGSSSWSLAGKMQLEDRNEPHEETDLKEAEMKLQRANSLATQVDSLSEVSYATIASVQKIQFCVHGICEPGNEIKDELVKVLGNKLNDAVFEQLNLLIARNPKCRLAPADVQFIQPAGHAPETIRISLPRITYSYMHPFIYFLRQYLLHRFHTPRFTETSTEFHFKNYSDKTSFASAEPLPLNDVYLYNRRETKGSGIACIHMALTDADLIPITVYPAQHKVRADVFEPEFYLHNLTEFINVKEFTTGKQAKTEEELLLEFKVWQRGTIDIHELQNFLISDIQKALCDIFLEYFVLFTPISEVPGNLQFYYQSRSPSRTSQATTPTFVKSDSRSTTPVSSTPFPKPIAKKFLSEPGTPAELRARSPVIILRNRSLNEIPDKKSVARKTSKESPRDITKSNQVDSFDSIEKTYETLEELFPLNPTGSQQSRDSPVSKKSESDDSSLRRAGTSSSDIQSSVSVHEVERLLPKLSGSDNHLGSPYDTLTDKEVEESFNTTQNEADDREIMERKELTWKEIERRKRFEMEARKSRRQYERGETGILHPCYHSGIDLVLGDFVNRGTLSVHKHRGSLNLKYTPELILKEIVKILADLASDIKPKVFKQSTAVLHSYDQGSKNVESFTPYSFERNAVKSDDYGESSTDAYSAAGHPASVVPGQQTSYIVIGRNMKQWRQCINMNETVSDEEEKGPISSGFCKQQYKPFVPDNSAGYAASRFKDALAPSCIKHSFVPRQKFYKVKFMEREVVCFTYNFQNEVNALLDKQLSRLYGWHNARAHLANCLALQKLGLYHHLYFTQGQHDEDSTSFCSSTNHFHITNLLKETVPVFREKSKSSSADIEKTLGMKMPSFDETFRDTAPSRPLHKENYRLSNDLVRRVGYQYQEITRTKINVESQQAKLREILQMWHTCGPHVPIFENRLSLLKRHSHFIHFCQTPLLFHPSSTLKSAQTNKNIPEKTEKKDPEEDGSKAAERRASKAAEESALKAVEENASKLAPGSRDSTTGVSETHDCQNAKSSKGSLKRPVLKSGNESSVKTRPNFTYLQKSTNAGILLLELSYRNDNLSLKMFSFDASRVKSLERFVTMQEHWLFQEDCNKYKDLMHIHSFAYDFQLRQAQQFLSGRNMIFYPGYPVQKLFERMIEIFPTPPAFSCCYLAQGTVSIPCSAGVETNEVFKYLSIHAERYRMDPAKITKIDDSGMKIDPSADQTILSYMYYTSISQDKGEFQKMTSGIRRDSADFDGNVVITLSPSQDKEVLNLKFFLVLTNRREFYPRRSLKSQMSSLRSRRKRTLSGSDRSSLTPSSDDGQGSGPKLRVRFSTRTSSHSFTEENDPVQGGPLKVPTWPGTLHGTESDSQTAISSPSSDTALLTVRNYPELSTLGQQRLLPRSPSFDPVIPRSSSNEAISSALTVQANIRKSSSSGQLIENSALAESNFLANEVAFVSGRLSKVACTCLSNCWRDFMWYQLLLMESAEDESSSKKQKKKQDARKDNDLFSQNWKLSGVLRQIRKEITPNISMSEMKLLLGLVKLYPIATIDRRMDTILTLLGNSRTQRWTLTRVLRSKFGAAYREFASEDSRIRYICLLNPKDLDMFILVTTGQDGVIQNIQAVYREEPRFTPSKEVRFADLKENERVAVEHIESVVSCLCFSIWNQLLPSQ